jgi:hypothetical protein
MNNFSIFQKKIYYYIVWLLFYIIPTFINAENNKQNTLKTYRGILRVESKVSAGLKNFDEIVSEAKAHSLDFIIISDQLIVKVEYGLPPFRNIFKLYKTRPSIISYGVEKYLMELNAVDEKYNDILVFPGADVAPYYFWEGFPLPGKLKCNQYSQQLTIFGSDSPEFYKKIPIIHNEYFELSLKNILKLWPLLIIIWGSYMIKFSHLGVEADSLTNKSIPRRRKITGISLCVIASLWLLNNKPFFNSYTYNQYSNDGLKPYQQLADYIKKHPDADKIAAFWSAPGITMKNNISGVKLVTNPYWHDIRNIDNFDGFAGVYGDALNAYLPGMEWDRMLISYLNGERTLIPFIVGEIDYHQKKRRIDNIQTIVFAKEFSKSSILQALKNGHSYGYFQYGNFMLNVDNASISDNGQKYIPGDTLQIRDNEINLNISGTVKWSCVSGNSDNSDISSFNNLKKQNIRLPKINVTIICNGKIVEEKIIRQKTFDLKIPIKLPNDRKNGYIRFYMQSPNAGLIVSNPIFYKKNNR